MWSWLSAMIFNTARRCGVSLYAFFRKIELISVSFSVFNGQLLIENRFSINDCNINLPVRVKYIYYHIIKAAVD